MKSCSRGFLSKDLQGFHCRAGGGAILIEQQPSRVTVVTVRKKAVESSASFTMRSRGLHMICFFFSHTDVVNVKLRITEGTLVSNFPTTALDLPRKQMDL